MTGRRILKTPQARRRIEALERERQAREERIKAIMDGDVPRTMIGMALNNASAEEEVEILLGIKGRDGEPERITLPAAQRILTNEWVYAARRANGEMYAFPARPGLDEALSEENTTGTARVYTTSPTFSWRTGGNINQQWDAKPKGSFYPSALTVAQREELENLTRIVVRAPRETTWRESRP